jgi:hypothetical protein
MCKLGRRNPELGRGIHHQDLYYHGTARGSEILSDNNSAISSSCQPISETRAVRYPAQKAKKAGYFLLVCTQTELYHTIFKKIKSLL